MKRFLAGTLAALMLLTAASCGKTNGDETTADSTADTSETTEATEYTPTEQNWPDGFDYTAINLADYIKLGKYKGVTVTLTTSSEITDADVTAQPLGGDHRPRRAGRRRAGDRLQGDAGRRRL